MRFRFWVVASAILLAAVAAAIVLIVHSVVAWIPVGLVAIVAAIRAFRGLYISRLERRIAKAPRAAHNVEEEPPSSPGDGPASGEAPGGGPVAAA